MNPSERQKQLLTLVVDGLRRKTHDLFRDLGRDKDLRSRFVERPAHVVTERIAPDVRFEDAELTDANRLLFALMVNERFCNWARLYQNEVRKRIAANGEGAIDKQEIRRDFVDAIVRFGTPEIVAALAAVATSRETVGPDSVAIFIIKSETYAFSSTWFIYKVSGLELELDHTIINPADFRSLVDATAARAKELRELGRLTDMTARLG